MRASHLAITGIVALVVAFLAALWLTGRGSGLNVPSLTPGFILSFDNNNNRAALLSGWSASEPWGVWSAAKEATIGVRVSGLKSRAAKLTFEGVALVIPDKVASQKVEVRSGETKLTEAVLTSNLNASFSVPITASNGEAVVLRLLFPNAVVPKDLGIGSPDARTVAFGIKSLRLDE